MKKLYNSPILKLKLYCEENIIRTSGEAIEPSDPNELPPVWIN